MPYASIPFTIESGIYHETKQAGPKSLLSILNYRHPGRWERDAGHDVVKIMNEKKPKHWDNWNDDDNRGHGNDGKHGKNKKSDR